MTKKKTKSKPMRYDIRLVSDLDELISQHYTFTIWYAIQRAGMLLRMYQHDSYRLVIDDLLLEKRIVDIYNPYVSSVEGALALFDDRANREMEKRSGESWTIKIK